MLASPDPLLRAVRLSLFATAPMNALGALLFAPPLAPVRALFGLPEAHPFFLWLISLWVFSFGLGYLRMAMVGPDRTFMMVGAGGKAIFALLVLVHVALGKLAPLAVLLALPDLLMSALFAAWCARR